MFLFIEDKVDIWLQSRHKDCVNVTNEDQVKSEADFVMLFRNMTQ